MVPPLVFYVDFFAGREGVCIFYSLRSFYWAERGGLRQGNYSSSSVASGENTPSPPPSLCPLCFWLPGHEFCRLEVTVWCLWPVRHVAWFDLFLKILERQGIVYFWNTFDCISSLHSCGWKMWFSPRSGWASPLRCEWKIDVGLGLGLSVFRIPPFFADEHTHGLGVKKTKICEITFWVTITWRKGLKFTHVSIYCSTVSLIGELDRKAFIIFFFLSFILYWGIAD